MTQLCPSGGIRVESGLDEDEDGVLSPEEVSQVQKLCNGMDGVSTQIETVTLEPGDPNCPNGGTTLTVWQDLDFDSIRTEEETESVQTICSGIDGIDGLSTFTQLTTLAPDESCPAGGVLIEAGLDEDQDGLLIPEEIISSQVVCNGVDAPYTQWLSEPYAPDETCPEGGIKMVAWQDVNDDAIYDPGLDLSVHESILCHGAPGEAGFDALIRAIEIAPGSPECAAGGIQLDGGRDLNRNGSLEADEITMTQLLCNAEDALPFLSQTVVLNPDPEGCPAGGTQLQLGPDNNLNGILDPEEIATETAICTAETPPETRIETVTLPGGLYLPRPFIVTRGQSETVVVEPGDHELLINTSYLESYETLVNLGFNEQGEIIVLAIPSTGPIDALRVNHYQDGGTVTQEVRPFLGLTGDDIASISAYLAPDSPELNRLYVLLTSGELRGYTLFNATPNNESLIATNQDIRAVYAGRHGVFAAGIVGSYFYDNTFTQRTLGPQLAENTEGAVLDVDFEDVNFDGYDDLLVLYSNQSLVLHSDTNIWPEGAGGLPLIQTYSLAVSLHLPVRLRLVR